MTCVVDCSIVIRLLASKPGDELLRQRLARTVHAPALIGTEISSVVRGLSITAKPGVQISAGRSKFHDRVRVVGRSRLQMSVGDADMPVHGRRVVEQGEHAGGEIGTGELPRVSRTGNLRLIHAASCPFRYSSRTSCGVRYPSVEWRRVLL